MALFDVDITEEAESLRVALSGEVDLSTVGEIEERVESSLDGGRPLLVLDLRKVTFLDSSGLRLMLRLNESQSSDGGRLVVVQGNRRVSRVLELTGAADMLELVADPSQATAPG